jgi:hypothetical protein
MRARHAQPLYALRAGHPPDGLTAVWGVARPQGGQPAAVFFPLGYPFPYKPESVLVRVQLDALIRQTLSGQYLEGLEGVKTMHPLGGPPLAGLSGVGHPRGVFGVFSYC